MNMLRYVNLTKFRVAEALYSQADAKLLAEPEDQDYYGIGSRSARWTINMSIGIVFGTLSPPIFMLTLINFAFSRVIYGYLISYAETKKPDLGGIFYVTKLRGLFIGSIIYTILMTGVLTQRAATW